MLTLPQTLLDRVHLLQPALGPVLEALGREKLPPPTPAEGKTAAAGVAKFIGDKGPCAKVAKRAELEACVTSYRQGIVALGTADAVAPSVKDSQAKLEAADGGPQQAGPRCSQPRPRAEGHRRGQDLVRARCPGQDGPREAGGPRRPRCAGASVPRISLRSGIS